MTLIPMPITLQRIADALDVLPVAIRAVRTLERETGVFESLTSLETWARSHRRAIWAAPRVVRASRDALWLLGKRERSCLPRSCTVFALLSAMGENPVIVTGVTRIQGKLDGHAWVELNAQPIPGSGDEQSPQRFVGNLRYPQRS